MTPGEYFSSASATSVDRRRFDLKTFSLQPQLSVLGDFTPSVETVLSRLGIKDPTVIPVATHQSVTDSLEALLSASIAMSRWLDNRIPK